jgi:hypothetical protein
VQLAAKVAPPVGLVVLALVWGRDLSGLLAAVVALVLVVIALFTAALTVIPGRATLQQAGVHVAILRGLPGRVGGPVSGMSPDLRDCAGSTRTRRRSG